MSMTAYPPLPSYVDTHEVRDDGSLRALGFLTDAIPTMALTVAEVEGLHQPTKLIAGGCCIEFESEPTVRVHLYDSGSDSVTLKPASDWDSSTLDASTATSARITYADSGNSASITFDLVASEVAGIAMLEATLVSATLEDAVHTIDLGRYRIKPFGPRESINGWAAKGGGVVVPKVLFPGGAYIPRGNQFPGAQTVELSVDNDWPVTSPRSFRSLVDGASIPMGAWYSHASGTCVALRTTDKSGRVARVMFDSDDGETLVVWASTHAEDNLNDTTPALATTSQLLLLRGTYEQAIQAHRVLNEEEDAPWLERDRLHKTFQLQRYGGDQVSQLPYSYRWVFWAAPHSASISKTDDEVQTRLEAELSRLIAFIGLNPIVYYYAWGQLPDTTDRILNYRMPDHRFTSRFRTFANERSYPIVIYTLMHEWPVDATWYTTPLSSDANYGYLDAAGDPSTLIVLDRDGNQVENTNPDAVFGNFQTVFPNFGNANARTHTLTQLARWTNPALETAAVEGIYLDAWSGGPGASLSDQRGTLAASQKGPGSAYAADGKVAAAKAMRDTIRAYTGRSQFMLVSEAPDETMVSALDIIGVPTALLASDGSVNHITPAWSQLYSDRIFLSTFDAFTEPSAITSAYVELYATQGAMQFLQGIMPTFAWFGRFDAYIVMQEGDANYDAWWVDSGYGAMMLFLRTLIREAANAPAIFQGRRLPALPGSIEEAISRSGFTGSVTSQATIAVRKDALMAAAWLWNTVTWGDAVTVYVVNHEPRERTVRLTLSSEQYPDIGRGLRYVYESTSGALTPVAKFVDVLDHNVTLSAYSVRRFDIYAQDVFGDG